MESNGALPGKPLIECVEVRRRALRRCGTTPPDRHLRRGASRRRRERQRLCGRYEGRFSPHENRREPASRRQATSPARRGSRPGWNASKLLKDGPGEHPLRPEGDRLGCLESAGEPRRDRTQDEVCSPSARRAPGPCSHAKQDAEGCAGENSRRAFLEREGKLSPSSPDERCLARRMRLRKPRRMLSRSREELAAATAAAESAAAAACRLGPEVVGVARYPGLRRKSQGGDLAQAGAISESDQRKEQATPRPSPPGRRERPQSSSRPSAGAETACGASGESPPRRTAGSPRSARPSRAGPWISQASSPPPARTPNASPKRCPGPRSAAAEAGEEIQAEWGATLEAARREAEKHEREHRRRTPSARPQAQTLWGRKPPRPLPGRGTARTPPVRLGPEGRRRGTRPTSSTA